CETALEITCDCSEADQAGSLSMDRSHRLQERSAPAAPTAGADPPVLPGDFLGAVQQEGERVVGDLRLTEVGKVNDQDALARRGLDIDHVVADAVAHEDAAAFQLVDHSGRERLAGD